MAETFNVLVEIPRGSKNKYEVDQETGRITLTGSGRDLLKNEDVKKAYLGT